MKKKLLNQNKENYFFKLMQKYIQKKVVRQKTYTKMKHLILASKKAIKRRS